MMNQLFAELAALPEVEAIALGGSRAGEIFDEKSDYDVYLYCTGVVSEAVRKNLLAKYCSRMEIGNCFWEYEDSCVLNNGVDIDILYRDLDGFCRDVASVVEEHQARNGYTTCMWHNLRTCKIVYDRSGRLQAAKVRFDVPYPAELKANIIARNRKLLHTALPAYEGQLAKAVSRGDLVSVNHRTTAFLESYFDILFALNELTHPGKNGCSSLQNSGVPFCRRTLKKTFFACFPTCIRRLKQFRNIYAVSTRHWKPSFQKPMLESPTRFLVLI